MAPVLEATSVFNTAEVEEGRGGEGGRKSENHAHAINKDRQTDRPVFLLKMWSRGDKID